MLLTYFSMSRSFPLLSQAREAEERKAEDRSNPLKSAIETYALTGMDIDVLISHFAAMDVERQGEKATKKYPYSIVELHCRVKGSHSGIGIGLLWCTSMLSSRTRSDRCVETQDKKNKLETLFCIGTCRTAWRIAPPFLDRFARR